jgi:hypothetical protein
MPDYPIQRADPARPTNYAQVKPDRHGMHTSSAVFRHARESGYRGAMYQAFCRVAPLFWPVLARGRLRVPACAGTTKSR